MFSRDFLLQIAATYGLTSEQTGVFLKRLLEGRSHIQIASALGITKAACLKRMAGLQEVWDQWSGERKRW
jgi:DNA-directed RNA polymerase specialized sigma24 family protein